MAAVKPERPLRPGLARIQIILVALLFAGPLLLAAWLYFGGSSWQPMGRTNHGYILEPIVNVDEDAGHAPLSALTDGATEDHWALVYVNEGACDDRCRDALYRLRQSRLMLGNEMNRVVRVFLHGDAAPDRVLLDDQHRGLITISDSGLGDLLDAKRPDDAVPGGLYLVDPLGNLVMYFSPDLDPGDMVDDIKHLLELSRIG